MTPTRTLILLFCAAIAMMVTGACGQAAEIAVTQTPGKPSIVIVTGELQLNDQKIFVSKTLQLDGAIVVFASGGGNLQAGIEIGKAIRLKDFATYVPSGSVCASACALAWLGGTKRLMASDAQVGFHAAYRMQDGVATESGMANAVAGAYLNSLGLPERAVAYITSAAPNEMQWLKAADAQKYGIEAAVFDLPTPNPTAAPNTGAPPTQAQTARPQIGQIKSVPKFRDYATEGVYLGPRSAPDLRGRDAYLFRTRLREAASQPANFAGHYRLTTWGCGTSCIAGAVVDLATGQVTFFPFSICCSSKLGEPGFNPIEFRRESRLVVFAGLRNEEAPDAAHFYEFTGSGFTLIGSVAYATN